MKKLNISKKSIITFFASQIAIVVVIFILFDLIPVTREYSTISDKVSERGVNTTAQLSKEQSNLIDMVRINEHHESYLRNALKLSKIDSISLLIDLRDSLAILSLKGVSIFESKISKIQINKGLKKLPDFLRDSLYSGPLQVMEDLSSIEKFPIVVKKPAKDTSEVNKTEAAPTIPKQNDVFVLMAFDNNMIIEIDQQENKLAGSRFEYMNYKRQHMNWFLSRNIKSLFGSGQWGYIYQLKIEIPREDAGSIYRALPIKPFVLVRY